MTEEPDEQLTVAVQERQEAQRLRDRLARAEQEAELAAGEARRLAATEVDERADVAKLESMSWSRILSALRGSHGTDLDRERAEAQRAAYESGMAVARAGAARREVESIQVELDRLGDVDAAYDEALAAKEAWITEHGEAAGTRLHEIVVAKGQLEAEARELGEADDAGVTAHRHLVATLKLLDKARAWADWDTFGGGGLITDAIKYDRLDQVQRELIEVDKALRTFANELADVHLPAVAALELDRLTKVFDVWFDNLFSDWAVRTRINDARSKVETATTQVYAAVQVVREQRGGLKEQFRVLEVERQGLLGG